MQQRTEQALAQQQARLHIVDGFLLAMDDLDAVVKAIRSAADGKAAKVALQDGWQLSGQQADALLNMSLRRLTGLAIGELRNEQQELQVHLSKLQALLDDPVSFSLSCCLLVQPCCRVGAWCGVCGACVNTSTVLGGQCRFQRTHSLNSFVSRFFSYSSEG